MRFRIYVDKNKNLKIGGVSLGGWSKSGDFSEVAASPAKRKKLVENITKFLKYTNMDFVDIDWEYAADVREPDRVEQTKMMKEHLTQNQRIKKIIFYY